MTNESFFGLTSLIRPKKEILWIGSGTEVPSLTLNSMLSKIKFLAYKDVNSSVGKTEFKVMVLSLLNTDDFDIAPLLAHVLCLKNCEKILVLKTESDKVLSQSVRETLNALSFTKILFLPEDERQLVDAILEVGEQYKSKMSERAVRSQFASQNDELTLQTSDLDQIVKSRSENMEQSKLDTDQKISKMRGLVRFVKLLTEVVSVEDLVRILRDDIKLFHRVKEPILAYANNQNQLQLMFYQGSQVVEKVIPGAWPQQIRIRLNDIKDSHFLANIFGRPFGKLLTLPLNLKRKSKNETLKVSAVLFFEHSLSQDEMKTFLDFIEDRIHPMSITLDRILLEYDLNEASLLWERTFDGLQDPVAIFDADFQILRANKSFSENLSQAPVESLRQPSLVHNQKYYQVHSYPISFGGETGATHIINHFVDMTLPHKLQKQMIQNEKMAALGHLAGHIAHELNNPLTGVRSLAQILVQQIETGTTIHSDLSEVEKAAERCQLIIKNLLEFSSSGIDNQKIFVSLNDIVNKTLPLLKTLISKYEIDIQLTDSDSRVLVEPHLMQQVVFNIINNAAQAMGDSGRLEIKTQLLTEASGWVVLSVKDSGVGIPSEIQNQIFDFFFTTKSQGQGTGLGLSISKNIIDRFNGRIEVRSETGQGSEFRILLPQRTDAI